MDQFVSAWRRLKALVLRKRLDRDLEAELSFHLAMREAECLRDGIPPDRARDEARRQFGNVTHFKEQTREMWTFPSFESLRQDVRFASRRRRRKRGQRRR